MDFAGVAARSTAQVWIQTHGSTGQAGGHHVKRRQRLVAAIQILVSGFQDLNTQKSLTTGHFRANLGLTLPFKSCVLTLLIPSPGLRNDS